MRLLHWFAAGLCWLALAAGAQGRYPERPIHVVVPWGAGGTVDFTARQFAQRLAEASGGSVVVENRAGGGGTIGAAHVARSAPDGYTLLVNDMSHAMLPAVVGKLPWDFQRDLMPLGSIGQTPMVLVVSAASGIQGVQDLVARARAAPGKLNYGSGGVGSTPHLAAEFLNHEAKVSVTHVPYKGGAESLAALIGGQIDLLFTSAPTAAAQAKAGKVRILAVTSAQRAALLPDVPTLAESGFPNYVASNWIGLFTPANLPLPVQERLQALVQQVLASPALRQARAPQGLEPGTPDPAAFRGLVAGDVARWTAVARASNIQPN